MEFGTITSKSSRRSLRLTRSQRCPVVKNPEIASSFHFLAMTLLLIRG